MNVIERVRGETWNKVPFSTFQTIAKMTVYTWRQMKTIAGSIGEIWEKIKTYFMWGQVNQATEGSLHFSIDTMSGTYPIDHYLSLLKVGGMMVLLSFPSEIKVQAANLNLSSVTGGTKDIEEMINFWAATKIYPEVDMIKQLYRCGPSEAYRPG
uniref:Uncharacterized protein n=1 Tax=Setaria viridis TaxID=4556 RepID=A0A4U6TK03_SETVI|nr:hypothetical protein SEVIR_7G038274v2 [Setaria viridis]